MIENRWPCHNLFFGVLLYQAVPACNGCDVIFNADTIMYCNFYVNMQDIFFDAFSHEI